jgi:ABC-type sugar transport system permease subunit
MGFGTQVLLYSNAMEQIAPSVLEAAELDGITPLREIWSIILPCIMGTVSTFMIASIAGIFTSQANLYSFYGEDAMNFPKTNTLGYYMFVIVQPGSRLGFGRDYYGYASALGLCCTAVVIVPTVLFRKFSKKFEE